VKFKIGDRVLHKCPLSNKTVGEYKATVELIRGGKYRITYDEPIYGQHGASEVRRTS
jgi:hypothetical protein